MRRFVFLMMALTLWSALMNKSIGQNDAAKVKLWTVYPGHIVTPENDTIQGYLMLKNLVANQDMVIFYKDSAHNKKDAVKYKPKKLKAYQVGPRKYESFKFKPGVSTYAGNDARTWHFILKVIDGPFSLYKWYYETIERSKERLKIKDNDIKGVQIDLSFNEDELKYITLGRKLNGDLVDFNSLKMLTGFKKHMSKLVSDDHELAEKIARKDIGYRSTDLEKIVNEYNEWYLKNNNR